MGWLFMHRDPHRDGTVTDFFKRQFEYDGSKWRLIDGALVKRTEFYGAVECISEDSHEPKGTIQAFVCLIKFCRGDMNFGYKDMDETMGPYVHNCPKRILDKLTPTENAAALEWRAACRAQIEKPRPKPGQTVRFAQPIKFTDGSELDLFKYVKGSRFRAPPDGDFYRITGWKDRAYTIA